MKPNDLKPGEIYLVNNWNSGLQEMQFVAREKKDGKAVNRFKANPGLIGPADCLLSDCRVIEAVKPKEGK